MHEKLKKMSIKAKKNPENVNFFLEVCLMELDQGKIINCVPRRTVLDVLVLVSKFGIVSVSYLFEKAGIAHP